MVIKMIDDYLLSISLSSVVGTKKAGDGRLKHLPPRRFSLNKSEVKYFCSVLYKNRSGGTFFA